MDFPHCKCILIFINFAHYRRYYRVMPCQLHRTLKNRTLFTLKSNEKEQQQQSSALNKLAGKFTDTVDACGNSYAIRKSFNMTLVFFERKKNPPLCNCYHGFHFHFCKQTSHNLTYIHHKAAENRHSCPTRLLLDLDLYLNSKHPSNHPLFSSQRCGFNVLNSIQKYALNRKIIIQIKK